MNDKYIFHLKKINIKQVETQLDSIDINTSGGMDELNEKLLKLVANCIFFIVSIQNGILPTVWKKAQVIPIRKNTAESLGGTNSPPIRIDNPLVKYLKN